MARQRGRGPDGQVVAAITGSVGKTSTKEMLLSMLGDQGRTHASVASYNNHWGVPLTLARMPQDTEFAIIEIGMNHPGEIAPLAKLTKPDVAMVTTVAAAHLEAFERCRWYRRRKGIGVRRISAGRRCRRSTPISKHAAILMAKAVQIANCAMWNLAPMRCISN